MSLAPVALFVYNRPHHSRRTIEALSQCPEFAESQIFVFSDGPKRREAAAAVEETRAVVRELLPAAELIAAPVNRGLANSIISGVGRLVEEHGQVIVVEDDLVVQETFLSFMNRGLAAYEHDERVMQIAGHMFGVEIGDEPVFLPFVSTWGWATWRRAWQRFDPAMLTSERLDHDLVLRRRFNLDGAYDYYTMLRRQKAGEVDSWGIRWNWAVFDCGGLVAYPPRSLVRNDGFDNSGTHTKSSSSDDLFAGVLAQPGQVFEMPQNVELSRNAFDLIKAKLRRWNRPVPRLLRLLRSKLMHKWNR